MTWRDTRTTTVDDVIRAERAHGHEYDPHENADRDDLPHTATDDDGPIMQAFRRVFYGEAT